MFLETQAETMAGIFAVVSRTLKLDEFIKLEPEAQRVTLEDTARLLKGKDTPMTSKRQLISYLEVLGSNGADNVKPIVLAILNDWNSAPL